MKTKTFFKTILVAILVMAFISCSKKSDTAQPATLTGTWSASNWGGVSGNICTFTVSSSDTTAIITQLGSQPFNFSVGDHIYYNITASGTGAYNATGKYTYGNGNINVGAFTATLTLQNNNKLLLVQYSPNPAIVDFTPPSYYFKRQ